MKLSENIILDKLSVDVRVIDVLPAYEKRLAVLRPIRATFDEQIGVIFNNKVYPLFLDCDGELSILLSGAVYELKNTKILKHIPQNVDLFYIEEPVQRSISTELHWRVERNLFGIYIYITAPDEILEDLVTFLSHEMKLNIISWGETLDPLWAKNYNWSIRLSSGLSVDTIKAALNRTFNDEMLDKYLEAKTSKQASELNQKYIQDISAQTKRLQKEIHNTKAENATILEQKEVELTYVYEELERTNEELQKYKAELEDIKKSEDTANQPQPKKRDLADRTIANVLFSCFPGLAFTPDAVNELKSRFQGSTAIWDLLNKLNTGQSLKLEKVNGLAGRAGWLELRKHINTGQDDRGRIYCRRANKNHNFDVVIHWKKNDKDQEKLFKKLANYPPFETNQTVFM